MKDAKDALQKFGIPALSGIVLGLVIGLVVNTLWRSDSVPNIINGASTVATVASSTALTTPVLTVVYNTGTDAQAMITVKDQDAGFAVSVAAVNVSLPTWVAVREVVGMTVGNILGAAFIQASTTNLTVDLLRATQPAQQYQVYLYQDDGDLMFDFERDLLITRDRNPLSAQFITK